MRAGAVIRSNTVLVTFCCASPGKGHGLADTLRVRQLAVLVSLALQFTHQRAKLTHDRRQQLLHQHLLFLKSNNRKDEENRPDSCYYDKILFNHNQYIS